MQFSEASSPKYRKVAFNGLPISDEKPQAKPETDEAHEESYVDALTLNLRHDTSDIYVPLPGSELALAVKRSVAEEIWSTQPGLKPDERVDRPFGAGWLSGLTAHLQFSWRDTPATPDPCESERPDPDFTTVVDENGTSHRFVLMWQKTGGSPSIPQFLPIASNRSEEEAFLMRLEVTNPTDPKNLWTYTFTRKFGTKLVFEPCGLEQSYVLNPGSTEPVMRQYFYYMRVVSATDRMGNVLDYSYEATGTLIPGSISCGSRSIVVENDGRLITAVTDPRGNRTAYYYSSVFFGDSAFNRLIQVNRPEGINIYYGWNGEVELDNAPPPSGSSSTYFYHYSIASITDPLGRTHFLEYALDQSKRALSAGGWYLQSGLPRVVSQVTLPNGTSSNFTPMSPPIDIYDLSGRVNRVTDAAGHERTYTFSVAELLDTKEFEELFFDTGSARKRFYLILWTRLEIEHPPAGGPSVIEQFNFNSEANMALANVRDYSGNVTSYEYEDEWSVGDVFPWLPAPLRDNPIFVRRYADPTSQINAQGQVKSFEYLSNDPTIPGGRVMTLIVDEELRRTEYDVSPTTGLRLAERVKDAASALLRETIYEYLSSSYPSFLTKTTVVNGTGGVDLVTVNSPDAFGYRASEIVGSLMEHDYEHDANGNQTSITDGRGLQTSFVYDRANRLTITTFADSSTKLIGYDAAGNKIFETDENGHSSVYEYDSLNRLLTSSHLMDGDPPIVTQHTYNPLGSRLSTIDPRGGVTTFDYDAIQRLIQTTNAMGFNTTQEFGTNSGSSVFNVSGFKPTLIVDPRGVNHQLVYDSLYRKTEETVVLAIGNATTQMQYDNVGNPILVIDPLMRSTATSFDGLNRPVQVIYPDGSSAGKSYTPGGLESAVTDEAGNVTQYFYDPAGRRVQTVLPVVAAGTPETLTSYDAAGNVASVTDPNSNVTTYEYDSRNRRSREDLVAISRIILTAHDFVGNVISVTDANGNVTTTAYDAANRARRITATDGAITSTSHDANGNVLTVTDPLGNITSNTYDPLNRLLTTTNGVGSTVHYDYDQVGNRTEQTDGIGHHVTFTYDELNRVLDTAFATGTESNDYDVMNKTSHRDALSRIVSFTYDYRNRLVREVVSFRSQDSRTRVYDVVGNLLSVIHDGEIWRNTAQTYDALHRVLTETSTGLVHAHTYDLAGNRLKTTYATTGRVLTRVFDGGNRLVSLTESASGEPTRVTTYSYDPQGNLLVKVLPGGSTELREYDNLNRVIRLEIAPPSP